MVLLYLLSLLIAVAVLFIKYHYSYWERQGVFFDKDNTIPFGCLRPVAVREKSMGMAIYDVYRKYKERFVGIYLIYRPGILVRDVDLVRKVLIQDFASFHDRGVYVDEENDPISSTLFAMRGHSWRTMRNNLGPSFTVGKLKGMFNTIDDIGNKMVNYLNTLIPSTGSVELDIKEVLNTFAIDIVGSVIFGLEINSFESPKNVFRSIVNVVRRNSTFSAIFGMFLFLCPGLAKFLFKFGFKNTAAFSLRDIIEKEIEHRDKHNIIRKDLLQLLIQFRNTGKIDEDDDNWNGESSEGKQKSLSLDAIAAQAFIFYVAGQETTAATAAFTMFELAQYPDLLYRVQQEIREVIAKHDGKVSFEALKDMKFLELCIMETLRKYPVPMLNRECTQDYSIPGTDKVIKKGTPIVISLFGIHRDPEYFPDPDKYDPERFLESNHNYNKNAYMPFGEGPRHCIAQLMGKMDAKLAVVKLLENFNVEIMEKREIEIDNHSISLMPKGGVKIRLSKK